MLPPMQPPGTPGMPQQPQQPQGIWGQLTGQGSGAGFAGNPLFMAGAMLASGGNPAVGLQMAQQGQQNAWSRQMQGLQMQKLQADQRRQTEQDRRIASLSGNPDFQAALQKRGIPMGFFSALNPEAQSRVAERLFETPKAAVPQTATAADGYLYYTSGPDAGSRVLPGVERAVEAAKPPGSHREYELAKADGYGGTYTDFLTNVKRQPPVTINTGGPPKVPVGMVAVPDPASPTGYRAERVPGTPLTGTEAKEKLAAEGDASFATLLSQYRRLGENASRFSVNDRANVDQLRRELGDALARRQSPGRAPTDDDREFALQSIPDPFGLIDSMTFGSRLDILEGKDPTGGPPARQTAPLPPGVELPPGAVLLPD